MRIQVKLFPLHEPFNVAARAKDLFFFLFLCLLLTGLGSFSEKART